ncbi:MadS family sensor histidine kinase [Gordonia rhizosphera]|uniref:Putative two-component histidine kinase n=1 Tax=Gordonia rhizosphera NBRC 16068 TaxID=1108045 RepID=K6UYF3_9ACTN|nr:GAF domain-containing sensor histidine kinase [Gordonia rhizosphera]GAB88463.1 putative two-component histidine kinase [Gordonia rhizosphera NBRC 16068]
MDTGVNDDIARTVDTSGADDDRSGGQLDSLLGLHSVKGSHYAQYRGVEQRLSRVVGALDRISRALVQTAEGPENLVLSVVRAAQEHLDAEWVVFALCDGELERTGPRHLMMTGDGTIYAFEGVQAARTPSHLPDTVLNRLNDLLRNQMGELMRPVVDDHHLHVPLHLDGRVVGGLSAWTPECSVVDSADLVVMRILARQAVVALLNAALLEESRHQLARAEDAFAKATEHAADLAARNLELERTQRELSAAMRQRLVVEERERIARELHDSVTQSVLSAGMQIEVCRMESDPRTAERLEVAGRLTRDAVDQLRSVIYALNQSPTVSELGLGEVLEGLCSMHMPADLATDVRIVGRARDLPDDVQHAVLRIAGEALFNTAVHAAASSARITLTYTDSGVALTVDDDGCGDPGHMRRVMRAARLGDLAGRHRGLANMAARAEELGGVLRVRRSRQGGVRIAVEIPVRTDGRPTGREREA